MKKYLSIICVFVALGVSASEPPHVPLKITELRTKSWYRQAMQAWHHYIQTNPNDESAWIQYFRSAEFSDQSEDMLLSIQAKAIELFPDSYISYYLNFKVAGWNEIGMSNLHEAISLNKIGNFALEDRLILSELEGKNDRNKWSEQVFNSGLIHSSTLSYNYNLLMSVSEGGILLTDALHTTIPIWILQDVMNVRNDVTVINLELARVQEDYLMTILNSKGLETSLNSLLSVNDWDVYYALTLPREQLSAIENRLYVVGLASTYGSDSFDHFEVLRSNVENKFLLDYLSIDFNGEPQTATGKVLSSNYIVPLMLLKDFYDQLDNRERSESLTAQIMALAENSQIKTRVELLLSQNETPKTFKIITLDVKNIDKRMKPIKGSLYASEIELSNRSYWEYMEYLRKHGYRELYTQGLSDISQYDDITQAWLGNYMYSPENVRALDAKRGGGDYLDYPVLDVTYENAKAYCEWLTVQYNSQEKRKFKKVTFRLPTRKEWTMAALGYRDFQSWELEENVIEAKLTGPKSDTKQFDLSENEIKYPWGIDFWERRNTISNEYECYFANVNIGDIITCKAGMKGDGFSLTSPAATYFANKIGLYDVIGNVAEMINEPGVAMGGSWNHTPEESTISSSYKYEGHDISVGFRLFMEVIEE